MCELLTFVLKITYTYETVGDNVNPIPNISKMQKQAIMTIKVQNKIILNSKCYNSSVPTIFSD